MKWGLEKQYRKIDKTKSCFFATIKKLINL